MNLRDKFYLKASLASAWPNSWKSVLASSDVRSDGLSAVGGVELVTIVTTG